MRFILERPLRGDFALIAARHADCAGNLDYMLTAQNYNPVMALAADPVLADLTHFVPIGMIPPDAVRMQGVLVDYILERGMLTDTNERNARRVAREIQPEMLVNLSIGLPSLVANYIPTDSGIFFQAEKDVIDMSARPKVWKSLI